jgi:UDP-2,3-diacylglucosamine pyrophosphatase LpxH
MATLSKLAPYRREIYEALGRGASKTDVARSLDVPRTTLRDFLNADDQPLPDGLDVARTEDAYEAIPVFHRHYEDLEKLSVYPLGDVHKGSPAHAEDRWQEWLEYLATTDGVSLLGTGDFLNSALKNSKSESYDEVLGVGRAKRELARELTPLADQGKIDGLCPGNHEDRIYRAVGDCPIEDIADRLAVNYFRAAAVFVYHVGDAEYDVYLRHGTGNAGGAIGSRMSQLGRAAVVVDADIYVSGHTHSQAVARDEVFKRVADRMVPNKRLYVSSGSFLNYEQYAACRGYVATSIGAPRIFLDGTRKDAHVSI